MLTHQKCIVIEEKMPHNTGLVLTSPVAAQSVPIGPLRLFSGLVA